MFWTTWPVSLQTVMLLANKVHMTFAWSSHLRNMSAAPC